MKKLLAALLCVMMVVVFMPTMAFAADEGTNVAKVGETEYATLSAAIGAVEEGSTATVELLKNTSVDSFLWIDNGRKITLDLGGNTLTTTGSEYFFIKNGSLTIKNGTVEGPSPLGLRGSSEAGKTGYSVLTIESTATIKTVAGWGIILWNASGTTFASGITVNVYGTIDTDDQSAAIFVQGNINTGENNVVNVYEGASLTGAAPIAIHGDADVNVYGGTITGTHYAVGVKNGSLNVEGGNLICTGEYVNPVDVNNSGTEPTGAAISVSSSYDHLNPDEMMVTISGGTISSTNGNSVLVYQSTTGSAPVVYEEGATVKIIDGDFQAPAGKAAVEIMESQKESTEVTGGTYSDNSAQAYVPEGTAVVETAAGSGEFVLAPKDDAAAQIGNAGYATLQAAIDAANNGDTVVLKKTVTENVEIKDGQNIVLDLNGNTLSGGTVSGKATLKNYGTVTIQDSSSDDPEGEIRRDDNGASGYYVIDNQGTMTIKSGNFYNKTGPMPKGSSLIRNAGLEKEATLNINGGSILHDGFIAVKNDDRGILNVTGGTIKTTGDTDTHTASAIQNWNKADITGGTIEGTIWTSAWSDKFPDSVTTISGDTKVTGKIIVKQEGTSVTKTPTLNISGGTFDETWSVQEGEGVKVNVTGGTFKSEDVAKYVDQKNVYEQKDTYYVGNPPANTGGNNTWVEEKDENGNGTGIFVEQYVSSGYYPTPTIQNPTIEASEGVTVTKGSTGTTATITVADGYELVDVTVNGVSKGKVTTLTGLKTGDKVVVTAQKVGADDIAAQIAEVKSVKLVARSAMSKAQGKKAVKITWYATDGSDVELDGVEIFRSVKRYSGFGKKPIFTTTKAQYHNTAIEVGTKYYYKVRGYKVIGGKKVYTPWSTKAWRTVK